MVATTYQTSEFPRNYFRIEVEQRVLNFFVPGKGTNVASTNPLTVDVSVYATAGRSGIGIFARGVYVGFTGQVPDGYVAGAKVFIPILQILRYEAYKVGDTGTFFGEEVKILGRRPEVIRS